MASGSAGIELQCPSCGVILRLDAGFHGGVCRCSKCGTLMTVPGAPTQPGVRAPRRPDRPVDFHASGATRPQPRQPTRQHRAAQVPSAAGASAGPADTSSSPVRPSTPPLAGPTNSHRAAAARPSAAEPTDQAPEDWPLDFDTAPTPPKAVLAGAGRRRRQDVRRMTLIVVIILLVVLVGGAAAAIYYALNRQADKQAPPPPVQQQPHRTGTIFDPP